MTQWTEDEVKKLSAVILGRIYEDLKQLDAKKILLLCSGEGDVAFWLAGKEKDFNGRIMGLELDEGCLKRSLERLREIGLEGIIEFHRAEKHRIPFPDEEFDALISEFIIFPTPTPTEIGQVEMARVLRRGGKMILTDVIATKRIPEHVGNELKSIGLNYLCYATKNDFKEWMTSAGLKNIEIVDLTPQLKQIWEERYHKNTIPEHREGYHYLLNSEFRLGETIFYIYVKGEKL